MPASFTPATWKSYTGFLRPRRSPGRRSPTAHRCPAARTAPACRGWVGLLTASNEGVTWQPAIGAVAAAFLYQGTRYYLPPKGSCFTAATRVLLPDGTDRALGDVRPGLQVWTPGGSAAVRVVTRAHRQGRDLHRLDGGGFAFSDSHPFVHGEDDAASLGVHPGRTAAFSPGLAVAGIGQLAPGARVTTVSREGKVTPKIVDSVDVSVTVAERDEQLVDLVLEPRTSGFPSYAVGDGGSAPFYLVRSEVLRHETLDYGTVAGIVLFAEALPGCLAAVDGL